ncbi:hypothetical protein [Amycolatopsis sp. NPDC059657]|uniref:hypothetical protein n=1 Tax=Amycolatopsis sp. NPDC059657 TaxID=3346899 RepID=UPI00366C01A7
MADVTTLVRTVVAGVLATAAVLCGAATASAATPVSEWKIRGGTHQAPDLGDAQAAAGNEIPALIAQCVAKNGSYVRSEVAFHQVFEGAGWQAVAIVTCRQN